MNRLLADNSYVMLRLIYIVEENHSFKIDTPKISSRCHFQIVLLTFKKVKKFFSDYLVLHVNYLRASLIYKMAKFTTDSGCCFLQSFILVKFCLYFQ